MSETQPKSNALRRVFSFITGMIKSYLISVGLLVTFLPILLLILATRMDDLGARRTEKVPPSGPTVVNLRIDGTLAEAEPSRRLGFLSFLKQEDEIYLPEIRALLRRAAKDETIKGVYLELIDINGAPAEFTEFRRLLEQFKASGKPVYAYLTAASTYNYYLASIADHIALPPTGEIHIPGPVFQLAYFADALKKLGVEFEVIRAGKYKSAMEPMIANAPSPETLEMYRAMEASLRKHIVGAVASARKKDLNIVTQWFKQSTFPSNAAVNDGIIDQIGYVEEHRDLLKTHAAAEHTVQWRTYLDKSRGIDEKDSSSASEGIAIIEAMGEIHISDNQQRDSNINVQDIRKELKWARENAEVKAVVVRISSPGGSATASEIIWKEMAQLVAAKPVIVSMGQYAASGGYYIAAPATKIIAEPTTITGSIGVIGGLMNLAAFKEKWGVHFHVVTQSDRARMLNPGERSSPFDRAVLETTIDDVYETFLKRVADGRKMDLAKVKALAQGRVYTGSEALELGLVDDLGGLTEAIQFAKEAGGLDPNKLYPMLRYQGEFISLSECLRSPMKMMRCLDQFDTATQILQPTVPVAAAERLIRKANKLAAAVGDEKILTLWPGFIHTQM